MTDTTNRFKERKINFFVRCDTFLNSEDQTSLQAEGFNHLKPSLASSKLSFFLFLKTFQNITQLGFSCLGSCRIQRIKVCKRGLSSTECSPRNSIVGPESLFQTCDTIASTALVKTNSFPPIMTTVYSIFMTKRNR